jgi:hypothetical protein
MVGPAAVDALTIHHPASLFPADQLHAVHESQ